jgi:hypothetical protein
MYREVWCGVLEVQEKIMQCIVNLSVYLGEKGTQVHIYFL